jgi:orotate phosphoribosyltransferase
LRRGYDKLVKDKRAFIVEDLMTTGGSVLKVVDIARAFGAEIAGVAVICNRGGVTADRIGNPPKFVSLVNVQLDSWEAGECPLCEHKIPVNVDIGHGKDFIAAEQNQSKMAI